MTALDLTNVRWLRSSHSDANGGACVEVAANIWGAVAVRDSKHTSGPVLGFTAPAWAAFVRAVRG